MPKNKHIFIVINIYISEYRETDKILIKVDPAEIKGDVNGLKNGS